MCTPLKPGVFASCCVLQIKKLAKMSSPRRARVIRTEHESMPASDALRLSQPKVFFDVRQPVPESYESTSAKRMFDTFA